MTLKEWRKLKRASYHGLRSRKRGVASIHVAEVDLPFVSDGRSAEQAAVLVEESDPHSPVGQGKSCAAALQAASQYPNAHL
jgi:hypothetical protein